MTEQSPAAEQIREKARAQIEKEKRRFVDKIRGGMMQRMLFSRLCQITPDR